MSIFAIFYSFQDEVEQDGPMGIEEDEDKKGREMDLKEKVLYFYNICNWNNYQSLYVNFY